MATKKSNKEKAKKKTCLACNPDVAEKPLSEFYLSKSPMHQDGKVPWCKECIVKHSTLETGEIDEEKFKNVLRQLDKPYYKDCLQSAINQFKKENSFVPDDNVKYYGEKLIGLYFKNINTLRQVQSKNYADSEKDGFIRRAGTNPIELDLDKSITKKEQEKYTSSTDDFEVTDEMVELFGEGYSKAEYKKMMKKYQKLKLNYSLQTNLHQEALATYVRFKVKEEDATARGDVEEAKKWYDASQNAATSGKLTPKQLTESDLQGGINSFSEIFKAVEQAVDVIPILPRFKYRPNDALDFNIWCYINYARDLQGLPQCEYEDVYKFYDKKKQEYLDQYGDPYGIFDDEPDESIRENIKRFITLPKDYMDGDE